MLCYLYNVMGVRDAWHVRSWGDVWRQRCTPRSGPLIGAEPEKFPAEEVDERGSSCLWKWARGSRGEQMYYELRRVNRRLMWTDMCDVSRSI